jgi:putative transposase
VRKSRYSDEQIVAILAESEAGVKTPELCRRYGINKNTFYKWKGKYGGMQTSDVRRLRQLEDENSNLKRLLAEAHLDIAGLKNALSKKYSSQLISGLRSKPSAKSE